MKQYHDGKGATFKLEDICTYAHLIHDIHGFPIECKKCGWGKEVNGVITLRVVDGHEHDEMQKKLNNYKELVEKIKEAVEFTSKKENSISFEGIGHIPRDEDHQMLMLGYRVREIINGETLSEREKSFRDEVINRIKQLKSDAEAGEAFRL